MSNLKPIGNNLPGKFLSLIYGAAVFLKNRFYEIFPGAAKKLPHLTISVGCVHAGGTGKTPVSIMIGKFFSSKKKRVIFLSRGYGRETNRDVSVFRDSGCSWKEIGDEPAMMLSEVRGSCAGISADRYGAAKKLLSQKPRNPVFILDDGFQHRKLSRDIDIICLPTDPFSDSLIPSGYMREPLKSCGRADIIFLTGLPEQKELLSKNCEVIKNLFPEKKVFTLIQSPDRWINLFTKEEKKNLETRNPLLISGIARPHRFIKTVEDMGITPKWALCYPDHHQFSADEIKKAVEFNPDCIITTEKDAERFKSFSQIKLVSGVDIWYLIIKLKFLNPGEKKLFFNFLLSKLN